MQTISNGETVSEIQSVIAKIQDLEASVATWNSWRLGAVAAAALVAAMLAVTSFVAAKKTGALTRAQGDLIRLKDAHLVSALSQKDVEIGAARKDASAASIAATEARSELLATRGDVDKLTEKNSAVEGQAAEARREAAAAKKRAEDTERKHAPRTIDDAQAERFLAVLAAKPKGLVDVEYPANNTEIDGFSRRIINLLVRAGWNVNAIASMGRDFPVGIRTSSPLLKRALAVAGVDAGDPTSPGSRRRETVEVGGKP